MIARAALCACWLLSLGACAPTRATSPVHDPSSVADAERLRVRERAPDLWALAETARARAERTDLDQAALDDARTEARLWLAAARTEAERIELAETRAEHERASARANAAAVAHEAKRAELAEEAERLAAGKAAELEAARALEHALSTPSRAPVLSLDAARRAAEALLDRTRLVLAAARALGADASAVEKLEARHAALRAELAKDPQATLVASDALLFEAHTLFGPLRERAGAPDAAMRRALADELGIAGPELVRNDRGLGVRLPSAFGAGTSLSAQTKRVLGRICALARAHPFGPVQAVAGAAAPSTGKSRKNALEAVLLAQGCPRERLSVEAGGTAHADDIELTFVAY